MYGKLGKSTKGVFFSLDALFALLVIFLATLVLQPSITVEPQESLVQGDLIFALSSLSIGELNNSYAQNLISSQAISDPNKSVLEQLGEFYVLNKTIARELADSIFNDIGTEENFGLWFGSELIASKNSTPYGTAKKIVTDRQVISGIQDGGSVTGFSSRAFLTSNLQNIYSYFGGYVGEGNLTARIEYTGNATAALLELAIGKNFSVYINGIYSGNFSGGSSTTPTTYDLPITDFSSGINFVEIRGENLYIAGGFLKVTYAREAEYAATKRYYFPGINGAINLYDSFYLPELISNMTIFLEIDTNLTSYLNLGNTSVFNSSTSGVENITINNSYLSSVLNYSALSNQTIPIRLGLENSSYVINETKFVDVFSVTDTSGSMAWQCSSTSSFCSSSQGICEGICGQTWSNISPMDAAKDANDLFIDNILNVSGHKVGLVGYKQVANDINFHNLSDDNVSLKSTVDYWFAGGGTCICCGINRGISALNNDSDPINYRSLVVMSDGEANSQCTEQGTGNSKNDAIQAACDAYDDHGIIVYAIGFGGGADEATLQSIASCGGGSYYYTDISLLSDIYDAIATEILEASFNEQTLIIEGNYTSRLFSESYIEFDYNTTSSPYGLITTTEKSFDNSSTGSFLIPENSTILEAKIISYSGSRWTDNVFLNGISVFNLSSFGSEYLALGDPYSINLPTSLVTDSNTVSLTTGLSPFNSTPGSDQSKIIYTISQGNLTAYSALSTVADGCNWTLEFNEGNTTSVAIPSSYNGTDECYYMSGGQNISTIEDAMQVSVLNLLELLDFDSDGRIDVAFSDQDLQITSSQITGIPYDWSTEVQARTWYE